MKLQENGQDVYRVGGVAARGYDAHCTTPGKGGGYAYLFNSFLDPICPNGQSFHDCQWEKSLDPTTLNWVDDRDHDGVKDSDDNCPKIANASQHDCDNDGEGDACDPEPCAGIAPNLAGKRLLSEGATLQSNGTNGWITHREDYARLSIRQSLSNMLNRDTQTVNTDGVQFKYCACHDPATGQPVGDSLCRSDYCPSSEPFPTTNVLTDVGYLGMRWQAASGSCTPADTDNNGVFNECEEPIAPTTHLRVFGLSGTPMCTDYKEKGCDDDDSDAFWTAPNMARTQTVRWYWKHQDFPHVHDPQNPVYDTSSTTQAFVRVWLHSGPTNTTVSRNDSFSEPQILRGLSDPPQVVIVDRPLYDLRSFFWLRASLSHWEEKLTVFSPIPPEGGPLPDGIGWPEPVDGIATQALAVTELDTNTASPHGSRNSVFWGDPEQFLSTAGFAAARLDEALFVFGGSREDGSLSAGLWFGQREGDEIGWQALGKTEAFARSASTGSPTAGLSKIPKTLPVPAGKSLSAWTQQKVSKRASSRAPLTQLAGQKTTLFTTAMAARTAAAKTAPGKAAAAVAGAAASSGSVATRSFASGEPLPQRHAVLVSHPDQLTLVALFGELESPRQPDDPVAVAIFDLQTDEWLTAEIQLSCGPRTEVAHGIREDDGARKLLFYGGLLGEETQDGLFSYRLDVDYILEGADAQRLDAGSTTSPGARRSAVLAYSPLSRTVYLFGGINGDGETLNDLWAYSLDTQAWQQLDDGSAPGAPPTSRAAALVVSPLDGSLIVVAGEPTPSATAAAWRYYGGSWQAEWTVSQ